METNEKWLQWAVELQALAQAGLYYTKDPYDAERFTRIREISAEIISAKSEIPLEKVTDLFCGETGYQTPKLDTRAAIIRDGKILLVRENNGEWSMPGGWMDAGLSVKENTVKEAREESGMDVVPLRIIAVQDRDKHNRPVYAYKIIKIFVLCEPVGGSFEANIETTAAGWFGPDELPELSEAKNTREQVEMCFAAAASETKDVIFD